MSSKKSPRILLVGIGGVYNYGCEAIVRGTASMIRSKCPDAEIVYATPRPEDDRKRLMDCDIKIVQRKILGRYSTKNLSKKILSMMGINWSPLQDDLALLDGIDVTFSIGGDIYTLDSYGSYSMTLPKFGDASLKRSIPYILWCASVGPFTANPKAENAYKQHLQRLSLIAAREQDTVKYLKSLGIHKNVFPCADPAFVVAPEIKADHLNKNKKLTIGLNLSPLSARYVKQPLETEIKRQAKAIERLIKHLRARIILVPHVISDFNEADDDLRYLWQLKNIIASEFQASVDLLNSDKGFIGTKIELAKCDIVIAARMHCAISALTACVPTVMLAYSQKSYGMCEYVYGNRNAVMNISDFCSGKGLDFIKQTLKHEKELRAHLAGRIPMIQREAYEIMSLIQKNWLNMEASCAPESLKNEVL